MNTRLVRVTWYRLRTTFHARRGRYLAIVLLIGLVGGVGMAAVAAGRRTQSAFPRYLAASSASDIQVQIFNPASPSGGIQAPDVTPDLRALPEVARVASAPTMAMMPLDAAGHPHLSQAAQAEAEIIGSNAGEFYSQDRVVVEAGRMTDPARADEMVATLRAAQLLGWHLGQRVLFGAYTTAQVIATQGDFAHVAPARKITVTLVGLVVPANQLVNDDVDRYPTPVLMSPALTRELRSSQAFPTYSLVVRRGGPSVGAIEQEIIHELPTGSIYNFHLTSVAEGQVERASRPEAIALGVFGAIAALAALLIVGQAINRARWSSEEDLQVFRSLGASPGELALDTGVGLAAAIILGGLVAVALALALSPLAPVGPAGRVEPTPGPAADWTVLWGGYALLTTALGGYAAMVVSRATRSRPVPTPSPTVEWGSRLGLPVSALAGLRFSLERGYGRAAVPVLSSFVGTVLAVAAVVTTLTFGASLLFLDSHPVLYGWNWSYAITAPDGGSTNVPPSAGKALDSDPTVEAWTGYQFANFQIDGEAVPVLLTEPHAALAPPILSGHGLQDDHQIVLGAESLARLHTRVGQWVTVSYGTPDSPVYLPRTRLLIAGTATFPAIGSSGSLHTSMGTGALLSTGLEPLPMRAALTQQDPNLNGPAIDVVRLKPGVSPAAGLRDLRRVADGASTVMNSDPNSGGGQYQVINAPRPAEIVNYQLTGSTPSILASGLAVGAIIALGLTLAASVRRRTHDMAVLKTLGCTQGQVAAAVAWQATVSGIVGAVLGIPIGIAMGRWSWLVFARGISVVPRASVPAWELFAVAGATLVVANLAAAVPGWMAARIPTGAVLRAE